jgi:hypothetical protein
MSFGVLELIGGKILDFNLSPPLFNFATAAQIVSDAFALTREPLATAGHPEWSLRTAATVGLVFGHGRRQ